MTRFEEITDIVVRALMILGLLAILAGAGLLV